VNCYVTSTLIFRKITEKFGQLSDFRAPIIHGLGFSSAEELNEFTDKLETVKDPKDVSIWRTLSCVSVSNIRIPPPLSSDSGSSVGFLTETMNEKLFTIPAPQEYFVAETQRLNGILDSEDASISDEAWIHALEEALKSKVEEIKVLQRRSKRSNDPCRPIPSVSKQPTFNPLLASQIDTLIC